MRNILFSLFAIGVAAVAAMTATTAMLNTPRRTPAADVISQNSRPEESATLPEASVPANLQGAPSAKPSGTPDTAAKPASGAASGNDKDKKDDDEVDKDPYEGIAPEELPPDLQYSADSSVSFPTNI
jgi:hypothetical protein